MFGVYPSLSDRCFVKLLPIIVWVVLSSRGAEFFLSMHDLFASVTKKQQNGLEFGKQPTPQTVIKVQFLIAALKALQVTGQKVSLVQSIKSQRQVFKSVLA